MTTDADRAFDVWWQKEPVSEFDGVDAGHVKRSWHAAVAWATAREREKGWHSGAVTQEMVQGGIDTFGCPPSWNAMERSLRAAIAAAPLSPTAVDDKETAETGGEPTTLTYRNYRGEVSERTITPKHVWFGSTEWHPEPQWLLTAFDHDKGADRDFALNDFGAAVPTQPVPPADLVELAGERFGSSVMEPMVRAIAAFAAEHAAGWRCRAESAEKDRDELLTALGFKSGPIGGDRQVILADVSGLRPEMAKARRLAMKAESEAMTWRCLAEEEREACAKVADKDAQWSSEYDAVSLRAANRIAAAIRARKGGADE